MKTTEPRSAEACRAADLRQPAPAIPWDSLCRWLTRDLHDVMTTIERRETNGSWLMECLSQPLEGVTSHETTNGVRVISVSVRMDGHSRQFDFAGPNSLSLERDAAGFPTRLEMGYQDGQFILIFSGPMKPQSWPTGNAWGE